jgi:hypothetical protein
MSFVSGTKNSTFSSFQDTEIVAGIKMSLLSFNDLEEDFVKLPMPS